jgi:hypothetical protein
VGSRDLRTRRKGLEKKKKNVTDRQPAGKGQINLKKKKPGMGSPPEKGGKGLVLPAD